MNYDPNKWDWMKDNDFMTYEQLIIRLRADLNEPDFFAYDLFVPHNEEEYSQALEDNKKILKLIKQASSKRNIAPFNKDAILKDLIKNDIVNENQCQ
ncbi:hypothetical protein [Latilactobacillus curvatus]|uniref:hypothetical protein n=1 Tax=Latilactobacillus curvatus TaxID=28038 RepID=UPI000FECCB51|nr:hypothetical protein [Latilactobacillus curvatus]QAR35231.1 hypothetical protein EQK21_03865 [Latilactobacillus curvatus]